MKSSRKFALLTILSLLTFFVFSCSNADDPTPPSVSNNGIKILALGDSRIEGARPAYDSYRYDFWKKMVTNNWEFDFIGPLKDLASYPLFMDQSFDFDHAGVGGFKTNDVLETLNQTLANNTPDIVLLGIGGNDLFENVSVSSAIANINQIIDRLQAESPSVIIFLEKIAPGRSDIMTPTNIELFNSFNLEIEQVDTHQTNALSKVVIVDMSIN